MQRDNTEWWAYPWKCLTFGCLATTAFDQTRHNIYMCFLYLSTAQAVGKWSASRPGPFNQAQISYCTQWIGVWVDFCLDDMEKWKYLILSGLKARTRGCPIRSLSLYRLRYSGYRENQRNYKVSNYVAFLGTHRGGGVRKLDLSCRTWQVSYRNYVLTTFLVCGVSVTLLHWSCRGWKWGMAMSYGKCTRAVRQLSWCMAVTWQDSRRWRHVTRPGPRRLLTFSHIVAGDFIPPTYWLHASLLYRTLVTIRTTDVNINTTIFTKYSYVAINAAPPSSGWKESVISEQR
jgi:hypothetical protein